jgi:hypothetical protein
VQRASWSKGIRSRANYAVGIAFEHRAQDGRAKSVAELLVEEIL